MPFRINTTAETGYRMLKSIGLVEQTLGDPRADSEGRGRLLAQKWLDEIRERVTQCRK